MDDNQIDLLLQEILVELDAGKTYAEIRDQFQDKAD